MSPSKLGVLLLPELSWNLWGDLKDTTPCWQGKQCQDFCWKYLLSFTSGHCWVLDSALQKSQDSEFTGTRKYFLVSTLRLHATISLLGGREPGALLP